MIILRQLNFSNIMLKRITDKLDRSGILDYEVSKNIPTDSISLTTDLNDLIIYIPVDLEYSQYSIAGFLRSDIAPYIRTSVKLDRNVYYMRLSTKLTEAQYFELVKHIIEEEEFCVLIDNN